MTGYDKVRKGYKWEVLALLWVAYLLNQADRQVFNVVLPLIREDLGLSDVAVGTIATVFNLFYAVLVPIGGFIGDRFSRKWIVTASVLFWSIATMFTGLCNGFLMLVVMRSIATGGGAPLSEENRLNLKSNGFVVFCDRDTDKLETTGRPLSRDRETLVKMREARLPVYTAFADAEVCNDGAPEECAEKITEKFDENFGH